MRPPNDVRLRRLFINLWEGGQGELVIMPLAVGYLISQANLLTSLNRTAHLRPPCRLSVPMLAITVQGATGASS